MPPNCTNSGKHPNRRRQRGFSGKQKPFHGRIFRQRAVPTKTKTQTRRLRNDFQRQRGGQFQDRNISDEENSEIVLEFLPVRYYHQFATWASSFDWSGGGGKFGL